MPMAHYKKSGGDKRDKAHSSTTPGLPSSDQNDDSHHRRNTKSLEKRGRLEAKNDSPLKLNALTQSQSLHCCPNQKNDLGSKQRDSISFDLTTTAFAPTTSDSKRPVMNNISILYSEQKTMHGKELG